MTTAYLIAALLLLLANGFFVGAEFALVASRQSKIEQLAVEGTGRARIAERSIRQLTLTLAGAQLGITMCSLGLGFVAEPAIAHLIEDGLSSLVTIPDSLLHTIAFVLALTVVTFFHMVIGEMAPKNIAIAEPERTALWLAWPFHIFVLVFRPVIAGMNYLANLMVKVVGVEPAEEQVSAHTALEIGAMVKESARQGQLREVEERLLSGAAGFGQRDATAAMIPRTEMVAVEDSTTPAEIEGIAVASGHTRLPVFEDDLDHVFGFFHIKDLLHVDPGARYKPISREFVRPILVVPESLNLHPLLIKMRRERRHLALVVDEHGGTSGIVTLEDLLEELVGEIRDEYDFSELGIEKLRDGRWLVPGTLRIDEAAERLGIRLPTGEYETVAGFLMDRLGRIPRRRDVVEHDAWRLSVRSMHRRRVVQVLIEPSLEGRARRKATEAAR